MNLKRIFLIVVLSAGLCSCVRYYPNREEMNRPYGNDPATEFVGADAFYLYDIEQRKRLEDLIHTRIKGTPESWDTAYKIGAGDSIEIEVKNFEEISKEYKVNLDGIIKLPFVGNVEVEGMTEDELGQQISRIVQDFVLEPQVHAEVTDHSAHKVWVVAGSYNSTTAGKDAENEQNRRAYPLRRPNYSLVELLVEIGYADRLATGGVIYLYPQGALHGGETTSKEDVLNSRRTTVGEIRLNCIANEGWAKTAVGEANSCAGYSPELASKPIEEKYHQNARIMIDLEELFGGNHKPPLYVPLRPGDAIYMPAAPIVQVYGETNRRGTFRTNGGSGDYVGGSAIKPTLMSVLAEAEGLTYAADIHNIEIYRELDFGRKVVMSVDFEALTLRGMQDVKLRDGDIIWVPSQAGRFIEHHSINAVNQALGLGRNVYTTTTP